MSEQLATTEQNQVPTIDGIIERELKKFDEVFETDIEPKIEQMKAEFLPLTINGLEDKKGYQQVADALRFVVSRRTNIEAKRKELKADSLKFGRAVDAKAAEITRLLEPIEDHLRKQKETVDNEKKRIEQEKEAAKQRRIEERMARLSRLGCYQYMGTIVRVNKLNADAQEDVTPVVNVEILSDEDFNKVVQEVEQKVAEEKAEQDRKDAERQAELKLQQEQAEALRKEQEALEQQKREIEEHKRELRFAKLEYRKNSFLALGLKQKFHNGAFYYEGFTDSVTVMELVDFENITDQDWEPKLKHTKEYVEGLKKADLEAKEKYEQEQQARIESAKEEARLQAQREMEQKQEQERIQKEQEQKLKAEQEAERLAAMSDRDKAYEYLGNLLEVKVPELTSKKYAPAIKNLREYLENVKL